MAATNFLRPVSLRLNNTPVQDLPRYAAFLAASILQSSAALVRAEQQKDENSVILHKVKTRISALLQDRTQQGRFTGIVLAKAVIDAGGHEGLASYSAWTRMLLSCLGKPDPPEFKQLAIITLSRIFFMTIGQPTLIREVTSPHLPTFISTTLGLIRPIEVTDRSLGDTVASPFLDVVLRCWASLIYDFSSTFRPFLKSFHAILLGLLADTDTSHASRALGIHLFAALHSCAPKNNAAAEWTGACDQVIEAIHQTADVVFRSVVEEGTHDRQKRLSSISGKISAEVKTKGADTTGMEKWTGMRSGATRLATLLQLLSQFLTSKHAQLMTIPLYEVLNLSGRLAAITPPTKSYSMQNNAEVSRDERDELWSYLPEIHSNVVAMLRDLVTTYDQALRPVFDSILSQLLDMFEAQIFDNRVHHVVFQALNALLKCSSLQISKHNQKAFETLIKRCCAELRIKFAQETRDKTSQHANPTSVASEKSISVQNQAQSRSTSSSQPHDHPTSPAWQLLTIVLTHASTLLSTNLRAEVDSCAILIGHQEAMLASVLNPPPPRNGTRMATSILPFVARSQTGSVAQEALLRPRMPVIHSEYHKPSQNEEHEQLEEEDDYERMSGIEDPDQVVHNGAMKPPDKDQEDRLIMSPQKRAFEKTEALKDDLGSNDAVQEPKRLRASSISEAQHDSEPLTAPNILSLDLNHDTVTSPDDIRPTVPESNIQLVTAPEIHQPVQKTATTTTSWKDATTVTAQWQSTAADSSDDDEIPTIDATMSDDDETDVEVEESSVGR